MQQGGTARNRPDGPQPPRHAGRGDERPAEEGAGGGRVAESPPPANDSAQGAPVALHPEAAAALETQLLRPGDVSNVLSEWDRFTVYRLVERTDESWIVEAVILPRRGFDSWFVEVAAARPGA